MTEQVPGHEMHLLTGAYAADALEAGERDAFEVHLGTCDACRQEVAELHERVDFAERILLEHHDRKELGKGETAR